MEDRTAAKILGDLRDSAQDLDRARRRPLVAAALASAFPVPIELGEPESEREAVRTVVRLWRLVWEEMERINS